MSVQPEVQPDSPSLSGSQGYRLLEKLLEALTGVSVPVNPRIYHQAGIGHVYPDDREEIRQVTMVEFPAFSSQLPAVRAALKDGGMPQEATHVRMMIEDIQADHCSVAAPEGASYRQVNYYRRLREA